jgi:hypothetical protein
MEKLIYLLWRHPQEDAAGWARWLRGPLARDLAEQGARGLQLNLVDEVVAPGAALRLVSRPVPDGFALFWMDSANARAGCEERLRASHAAIAGYLVTESLVKDAAPQLPDATGRSWGFSLIGLLQQPPRLTRPQWLDIWLGSHTRVAVETQPTFRYVQNVVARPLTADAPVLDAVVEEGFPLAALTDPAAFYDAVGDAAKHQANHARMMESCHRFIDFDRIDSLPTSEYVIGSRPVWG